MSLVAIALGVWFAVAAVVTLFAMSLGRAAAIGDEVQREQILTAERAHELRVEDRRSGEEDRRAQGRPWATEAPGRRAEDVLRRDLADARRALVDAEERLAEIEARRSA